MGERKPVELFLSTITQAATARAHGLGLATRNAADFAGLPVERCNPFT